VTPINRVCRIRRRSTRLQRPIVCNLGWTQAGPIGEGGIGERGKEVKQSWGSRNKRSPECRASERTLLEFCGGQRRNSIPDQLEFLATADATPVRLPERPRQPLY
jgi:hypothetical protein